MSGSPHSESSSSPDPGLGDLPAAAAAQDAQPDLEASTIDSAEFSLTVSKSGTSSSSSSSLASLLSTLLSFWWPRDAVGCDDRSTPTTFPMSTRTEECDDECSVESVS